MAETVVVEERKTIYCFVCRKYISYDTLRVCIECGMKYPEGEED
jgi:hypothetical protein